MNERQKLVVIDSVRWKIHSSYYIYIYDWDNKYLSSWEHFQNKGKTIYIFFFWKEISYVGVHMGVYKIKRVNV